jgi:hypothetical protein
MSDMASTSSWSMGAGGAGPCNCRSCYSRLMIISALLKLSLLHLKCVLKVDDPVGTDIHLLPCDVEQLTGVVPPMLGLTKSTILYLQLTVLLQRWECTSVEDGILMPQPL